MGLLEGRVALVTGGSRGIGSAIVRRFVEEGASVAFTWLSSPEKAAALAEELSGAGRQVRGYQSDAADHAASEALVEAVMADFGRLDILVNNAGVTRDNLMLRMTEEQWDDVIRIDLKSVFNLTRHALKPMLRSRGGSIINISSVVGVFGNAGQANYAAAKAGILGFTKSVAKEVGSRSIRCNAIAPGFIETDMTHVLDEKNKEAFLAGIPLRRLGQGSEVADACVFLGSDMSRYITGQTLSVCGGLNT
jgi:3-oxoacyl-[acyl-carrier protein] reductase